MMPRYFDFIDHVVTTGSGTDVGSGIVVGSGVGVEVIVGSGVEVGVTVNSGGGVGVVSAGDGTGVGICAFGSSTITERIAVALFPAASVAV